MTGDGAALANAFTDNRVLKASWCQSNLGTYQFFVDGKPTPASPLYVRNGFSENMVELSRALYFAYKSQKGPVIESGINTLNSLITLTLTTNQGRFYQVTTYQTLTETTLAANTASTF